jgi:peptidoglycan/LPS O-acetylase OafA/YrhL
MSDAEKRSGAASASVFGLATLILAPGAFRLALAGAVVVSHVSAFDIGRLGVLLFFYLSGYWTARIWAEKFASRKIGRFYAARYLRIAPLFYLVTVGAALLRHQPLHFVNLSLLGIASTDADPTGVSWSLDIELQFYLLLPWVAAGLSGRWRAPVLAAIGLLAVAGWYLESYDNIHTVAKYLPVFALGVLTYGATWKPSLRVAMISAAGFLAMTAATAFTPFFLKTSAKPFDQDIWSFLWMLPLVPYVMRSLTVRSTRLDRHLGNLSYPLYLVHFAVIASAMERFGQGIAVKLGGVSFAIAAAVALYVLIDRPVDRWRVRLTESGPDA